MNKKALLRIIAMGMAAGLFAAAYGSDWQFDYEEFVKYDAVNRLTSANVSTSKARISGKTDPVPHTPPVIMKRSKR